MLCDKLPKLESDQVMENDADNHFSGLHCDEYPATKHKGANKVPFIIGTSPYIYLLNKWGENFYFRVVVESRVLRS